ncbi:MAG: type II toxin -antitoxin system TacA 1-like antitoxin [Vulcanimicrobiaceae bacterium]
MSDTLSIRLESRDRKTLERAARKRGTGLSSFVRDLAESEARRLRQEEIRAEGERIVAHLAAHPVAREELETYGTPIGTLP